MKKIMLPSQFEGTELEEAIVHNKLQAEIIRKQGQQLNAAVNRMTSEQAFANNIVDRMKELISDLPSLKQKYPKRSYKVTNTTMIISDLHYIFSERDNELFDKIISKIDQYKPKKIYFMGDILHGQIRPSDKFNSKNRDNLIKSTINFGDRMIHALKTINFKGKIFWVYGNHGELRIHKGAERLEDTDNIEMVIAWGIKKGGFDIEDGSGLKDGNTYLIHGHLDTKKLMEIVRPIDCNYVIRGHYHTFNIESKNGVTYMQVPTAMKEVRDFERKIGVEPIGMITLLKDDGGVELIKL